MLIVVFDGAYFTADDARFFHMILVYDTEAKVSNDFV